MFNRIDNHQYALFTRRTSWRPVRNSQVGTDKGEFSFNFCRCTTVQVRYFNISEFLLDLVSVVTGNGKYRLYEVIVYFEFFDMRIRIDRVNDGNRVVFVIF